MKRNYSIGVIDINAPLIVALAFVSLLLLGLNHLASGAVNALLVV